MSPRQGARIALAFGCPADEAETDSHRSRRPADFDPFDRATLEDPYPFYRALRDHAPVYRPPAADWWYVTRHADIERAARDTETFSSNIVTLLISKGSGRLRATPRLSVHTARPERVAWWPVDVLAIADPPDHRRHRKLSTAALGRNFPRELEAQVSELGDALLDRLQARGGGDWMAEFAFQIPMQVALSLLELDRCEHERVKRWSDGSIELLSGTAGRWRLARDMLASVRMWRWCARAFDRARARRPRPAGLMGGLIAGVEDGTITATEAASVVLQVLIAGSDSSASLIGSAVRLLAEDRELQDRLRAEPSLVPAFVEEAIRLEAPFQGHFRQTTRPCELGGVELPQGARLFLTWASGNRDVRRYERPDEVLLTRERPRSHLSFGHGIHLCIGAALGRLEARVAITKLLARTRSFSLGVGPVRHRPSVFVRTLERLPITFDGG